MELTAKIDPEDHKRGRYLAYWLAYRNVRLLSPALKRNIAEGF